MVLSTEGSQSVEFFTAANMCW